VQDRTAGRVPEENLLSEDDGEIAEVYFIFGAKHCQFAAGARGPGAAFRAKAK
jgi:hypothetical protein